DANYAGMKNDKYSLRSGLTTTIVEGLTADIAFNLNHNIRESQNQIGNETDADFYSKLISTPDWIPMYIDGLPVNISGQGSNPLAIINSGYLQTGKSQDYNINASLNWAPTFLKGFSAKLQVSQRGGNTSGEQYIPPYRLWNFQRMGNNGELFSTDLVSGNNPYTDVLPKTSSTLDASLGN